uniref:Proline-rich transmembrane protein 3/4 domain-containing protein n=1 Tax=Latimeria chalumnae TaxID=7897 RepID=H3B969_LATCH
SERRGHVEVKTQRNTPILRLPEAPADLPFENRSSTQACRGASCSFQMSNKTLLRWNDLKNTLSFAWEMHIYGTGTLFLILSLISVINLIGSPIMHVPDLALIMIANAVLFLIGILRAVYLFTDPYSTTSKLPSNAALVLYNVTFPLAISVFGVLVLLMLKMARLQVLPSRIQSLTLLSVVAILHCVILLTGDLLFYLLNPAVNVVLQVLSVSWGTFLVLGYLITYYKMQQTTFCGDDTLEMQLQDRTLKRLQSSSRVMVVSSVFGVLCCGLQVYAVLWLYGILGKKREFSWSWWFLQFWYRIFELAMCFSMSFVASYAFCQQRGRSDHTCWTKVVQYFCNYSKTEAPEYPNNCYDWASSPQDKPANNDISKNLIRNQPENVPLKTLKENNENKAKITFYNNGGSSTSLIKQKGSMFGPKSQNVLIGRSYSSICFEKESVLSLTDFDLRPPSPINLSKSIDEALFSEHLFKDSIFQNSSLQYPSYLIRQDSCSSLKEHLVENVIADTSIPLEFKRRSSNPDCLYSLARCSSLADVTTPSSSDHPGENPQLTNKLQRPASGTSLDSLSKGSLKISWNPWRHGLSSAETIPPEDLSSVHLAPQEGQLEDLEASSEIQDPEKEARKSFIEISKQIDSQSVSSDTIEL